MKCAITAAAVAASAVVTASALAAPQLQLLSTYRTGLFDQTAAEIAAFDPINDRVFVTNSSATGGLDVLDISNPLLPVKVGSTIALPGDPTSVAFSNGLIAVAVNNDSGGVVTSSVEFYNADLSFNTSVPTRPFVDAVTFTPDGSRLLVAVEGEGSAGVGGVDIIDATTFVNTNVSLAGFNGNENLLRAGGVRLFPGAVAEEDLEPEFISVSPDGNTAYITLQEANTVLALDLNDTTNQTLLPLGAKNHLLPGNGIDPSDRDSGIDIRNVPVFGLYMPDAIATYTVGGQTFFVTANEGDDRGEDERIKDLDLDPVAFPNAAVLKQDANLGRLGVSTIDGDLDGDGDYDRLFAYGSRSFSIFSANGQLVFDSGDDFEQITAAANPAFFNSTNDENDFESRSDAKGPEPEGVTLGEVDGRTYAFIGLERVGGIMVYDVTDPANASFVQYINNRDFTGDPLLDTAGDLGPEGLVFVSAADSPTGNPLLIVTNEVSGSTTFYSFIPEPTSLAGLGLAAGGLLRRRR